MENNMAGFRYYIVDTIIYKNLRNFFKDKNCCIEILVHSLRIHRPPQPSVVELNLH